MQFRSLPRALEHDIPSQITSLHLSSQNLGSLPAEIGNFSNLRVLNLEHNNLTELPEEIGLLKNLTTLNISINRLTSLPHSMKNLTKLISLNVNRNDLENLPEIFEYMTSLKTLEAKMNKLNTLPQTLRYTPLINLDLRKNGFVFAPNVIFHMPSLINIQGILSDSYTSPSEIQNSFNKAFEKTELETDIYREAFSLLTSAPEELPNLSLSSLLAITRINFPTIRHIAISLLLEKSNNQPLEAGSVVSVLGNINLSKTEIKEKLTDNKINYLPAVSATTTHIIVGTNPKNVGDIDDKKSYTIWTEKDLNDFFNTIEKPYLLEITDDSKEQQEQLSRLITSSDADNVALGLQIIKGGGVPENMIDELFYAFKMCEEAKIKNDIKKIILLNTSPNIVEVLNKRDHLFNPDKANRTYVDKYHVEKELYKTLKKYSSFSEIINWEKIAYLLYQNFGFGSRYIFTYGEKGSQIKKEVLQSAIVDSKLDFNAIYIKGKPSLEDSFAYPYYTPQAFPTEILDFTALETLKIDNCLIDKLPAEISGFKNLKNLDISYNFLQKLPAEIGQLTNLETLNIEGNEFKEFPKEIYLLKNLKNCNIRNNRKKWNNNPLTLPADFQTHLPNCKIDI